MTRASKGPDPQPLGPEGMFWQRGSQEASSYWEFSARWYFWKAPVAGELK